MNIFDYYDSGLSVIPLNGKRPIWKDWSKYCLEQPVESLLEGYTGNIGLPLGPYNKVVALDIDTDNKDVLDKAPKSPLWKKGMKGETRFFKYNGEKSRKRHDINLELLSTGNQTVLPPSIHPDTNKPYVWGGWVSICDWGDLPTLPSEFVALFNLKGDKSDVTPSDGSRCNHGSHTKLSEILVAMIKDGAPIADIIERLISYDKEINPSISYFLCPSRPWRSHDKMANCLAFITEAVSRHGYKEQPTFSIIETPTEKIDYKKYKLPKLRGIAQEMFQYIYDTSPVPRSQLSFASAISTMSLLIANKIQFQGTLPNLYTAIICPSGGGKDRPLRFPIDLLSSINQRHYIGESSPASDTAILMNLPHQQVRIDVIDEASSLFASMGSKEGYLFNMANVYQMLYTSAGKYFAGKSAYKYKSNENQTGRLGECENPYVNILCGLTVTDFNTTFSSAIMDKGLGGRFLYFVDNEPKASQYPPHIGLPANITYYAEKMLETPKSSIQFYPKINNISIQENTSTFLMEQLKIIDKLKLATSDDSRIKPFLNRLGQTVIKMALIDSCSIQWEKPIDQVVLKKDSIEWAVNFAHANLKNMETFINLNMADNGNARDLQAVEAVILNSGSKGITLTELCHNHKIHTLGLLSQRRKQLIQTLIEDETIFLKDSRYYSIKFIEKCRKV